MVAPINLVFGWKRVPFPTEPTLRLQKTVKVGRLLRFPLVLSSPVGGVKLSLSRYPLDKDKIQSIGVMIYDKKDGPFQLHIDWINTYVDHDLK